MAEVRTALVESFGDYHSRIGAQTALVDQLIAMAAEEERARCAAIAERAEQQDSSVDGVLTAQRIAAAIRG